MAVLPPVYVPLLSPHPAAPVRPPAGNAPTMMSWGDMKLVMPYFFNLSIAGPQWAAGVLHLLAAWLVAWLVARLAAWLAAGAARSSVLRQPARAGAWLAALHGTRPHPRLPLISCCSAQRPGGVQGVGLGAGASCVRGAQHL